MLLNNKKSNYPNAMLPEAYHGLAGKLVKLIEPHTEADPAGLLLQFLVMYGNVVGRNAHIRIESTKHYPNIFVVIAGTTSKGRKGTSFDRAISIYKPIDPKWYKDCVNSGSLSSAEGVIYAVRDALIEKNEDSTEIVKNPGIDDKRLFVYQGEFASALKIMERAGNALSPLIRSAWDTGNLSILIKNNPNKATGAHLSVVANITIEEVRRYLTATELANGFGNRFLWCCVKRSKKLALGGNLTDEMLTPFIEPLQKAVVFGQTVNEISFEAETREIWKEVYEKLSEDKPGLFGQITGRAEAQTLRLALIYALLDCSNQIKTEHLSAALAVWQYCEDSCLYIFGNKLGDPIADKILTALRSSPNGLTQSEILKGLFQGNRHAAEIDAAILYLEQNNLIKISVESTGTRPITRYKGVRLNDKYDVSRDM